MSKDITVRKFNEFYEDAFKAWDGFFGEAARDLNFYLGNQWDSTEKSKLFEEGRNSFVFNRIKRNISMVTGYQRKNRLSSVAIPIENSDQKTADQLSQLLLYVMNYGSGYQLISDCFSGALKTGWNLANIWVDYRDDPVNGDIKFGREPYNGFIVDPYFTKLDFSDCSFILKRKYLSKEHVASLLPGKEREISRLHKIGYSRDDKFSWLPYQNNASGQELMAYNEMYEMKWKNVPLLVDMETGETLEFDMDRETINMFLENYPQLKVVKRSKQYIEKTIIVNEELMGTETNPYGLDEYPCVPFIATFEPESDQWDLKIQSLTRCMIDPQRESNRRRSQMIDLLDSQINSGWIADENSVINPSSLFQTSQGKVIWRKEDSRPGSLEKIPPAQIPPSMFQLQELFDRDIVDIAGINDAAFGQTETAGDSGVMMMLRQGAALINLQELFDNLRFSQKMISQKVLKLVQQWKPEKVKRILNEDPTQEFYDRQFTKYDVAVQEGILTDTQRQMYFRQLIDIKQLGAPVTGEMLAKAAPIQGKSEYLEELQKMEQQQAQAQQQQMQMQQQLLDSQRQSQQAKAISDIALSKERYTRAVANNSLADERAAAAVEDRSNAALQRVKTIKELQTIDDDRLVKYLNIIRMMEEMSKTEENEIKKADVAIASQGQAMGDQLLGIPNQELPQVTNNVEQPMQGQNMGI